MSIRGRARYVSICMAAAVLLCARRASGEDRRPPMLQGVGIDQRLNQRIPLALTFRDERGQPVQLGEFFGRKPVILAFVYYDCPMLCTLVLNGLTSALKALSLSVGEEFEVVTVSIDPKDTPAAAAAKKETYLARYRRPSAGSGWHFLTGEAEAVAQLTDAVGFHYRQDPASGQFAHAAGIIVLTPAGLIARYFFGVEYSPRDLRLGLIEAADSRIGSPIDQLLLYCFQYDASMGRYSAAVLNIVRLAGILTVLLLVGGFVVVRRRESAALRSRAVAVEGDAGRSTPIADTPARLTATASPERR